MARLVRMLEMVKGEFTAAQLAQRIAEGWQPVAIEWQRPSEGEAHEPPEWRDEVPYGLRVADDCMHLEEHPIERQILFEMMELLVQEMSMSEVAERLNDRGFRTRQNLHWSPVSVFNMLPRLIEVGPRMFTSEEWVERRPHLFRFVSDSARA